ncbi:MAG TPA: hypothetical protein VKW08_17305 [Xanthobacteraceae bacterium]|jgi:hypothetical protein|nr:hypothetical protein [Xanthobacteraceae bacterium]
MSNWLHQIALRAKAKTGFAPALIGWYVLAAVSLILGLVFLAVAAFVALSNRFNGVIAGLIMGGAFLLIAVLAMLAAWGTRLHIRTRAERELSAQARASWFDPAMLNVVLEVGRTIGWRRIATLAAAGVFAAGLGREWSSHKPKGPEGE